MGLLIGSDGRGVLGSRFSGDQGGLLSLGIEIEKDELLKRALVGLLFACPRQHFEPLD